MEARLQRSGSHSDAPPRAGVASFLAGAALVVGLPLVLVLLMGYRLPPYAPDARDGLRADLRQLEEAISKDAADVASLRILADEARSELAALNEQREAARSALASFRDGPGAALVPGANQPLYSVPGAGPGAPGPGVPSGVAADLVVTGPLNGPKNPRSARDYLLTARQHIAGGRVSEAQVALEMAETRALNETSGRMADLRRNQLIEQIREARRQLGNGDEARTLQAIDAVTRPGS